MIQFAFRRVSTLAVLERRWPAAWHVLGLARLRQWAEASLSGCTTGVMIVNTVVIVVESVDDLQNLGLLSPASWEVINSVFSLAYVLQVGRSWGWGVREVIVVVVVVVSSALQVH